MKIGAMVPGKPYKGVDVSLDQFCRWCAEDGFQAIDIRSISDDIVRTANDAGLTIASSWLPGLAGILSSSLERQQMGAKEARAAIEDAAKYGIPALFCELAGTIENPSLGRAKNLELLMKSFPQLVEFAHSGGVALCVEGYPGPDPHRPALAGTTELLRAFFDACPNLGFIYDPSHSVRIGADYIRVLNEFKPHLRHVHAKDTAIDSEALYLYGTTGPTFHSPRPMGVEWWRYCIPGEGTVNWANVVRNLEISGFDGVISVELEDDRYYGDWEAQALGFHRARMHLARYVK